MKNLSISFVLKKVVIANFLLLLLGFLISQTIGIKLHYFVFIASSILIFLFSFSIVDKPSFLKTSYLGYLMFLIFISILKNGVDSTFLFTVVVYFLLPIVFYRKVFSNFDLFNFLNLFRGINIFFGVGLILQLLGNESVFLDTQFTYTLGELQLRFGSFAGSSLLLGFTACVLLIFSFFGLLHGKSSKIIHLLFILIGLFNLMVSQSRRFYIFIFIAILLMMLFKNNSKNNKRYFRYFLRIILVFIILIIIVLLFGNSYFLDRLVSVFDFKNDSSNSLRVIMWIKAINNFISNFWLGTGLGTTTVAGKDIWSQVDSIEDIVTTESYVLKNFVEGGLFFGLFFLVIIFSKLKKGFYAFKSFPNSNKALAGYFIFFFFLDSTVGTTLESILSSVIFWISASILQAKENKLTLS